MKAAAVLIAIPAVQLLLASAYPVALTSWTGIRSR
jgi:hypothetical protein